MWSVLSHWRHYFLLPPPLSRSHCYYQQCSTKDFPLWFLLLWVNNIGGQFSLLSTVRKLNSKQYMCTLSNPVSTIRFFFFFKPGSFLGVQNQGTVGSWSTEHKHHKKICDNRVRKGWVESVDVDRAILLALIYCGSRRVNWLRAAVIDVFGQFSSESRFQTREIYSCSVSKAGPDGYTDSCLFPCH